MRRRDQERRVEGEEGVGEEDRERGNRKRERECVIFYRLVSIRKEVKMKQNKG